MKPPSVLVLSADALIAALLGALVETLELVPAFAALGERPRDALLRVRPRAALLDCEDSESCSESFLGPATMMGVRVILFGSRRSRGKLEEIAAKHRLPYVELPAPPEPLEELIRGALLQERS